MTLATFWKIIADARTDARNEQEFLKRVRQRLRRLSSDELVAFQRHFYALHAQSYSFRLWGAAYLMNGGCSDDCFDYFRAWLIAQGQRAFENAVENPESLAEFENPEVELEDFMYIAQEAYKEKTGREMPDASSDGVTWLELGKGWDFDDPNEMKNRYPKLFAKHHYRR